MIAKELLNKFIKAFDDAMEEIESDINFPFNEIAFVRKWRHAYFKQNKIKWYQQSKCLFEECTNLSINKSHTLSKKIMLKEISENNHLICPKLDFNKRIMIENLIGVNDASTFPGFCSNHENAFDFEKNGKIGENDDDYGLQLFRTISREFHSAKHYERNSKDLIKEYKRIRNEKLKKIILNKLNNPLEITTLDSLKVTLKRKDWRLKGLISEYLNRRRERKYFENNIYNGYISNADSLTAIIFEYPFQLYLALAGKANITVQIGKDEYLNIVLIINIVPTKDNTVLLILSEDKYIQYVIAYIQNYTKNAILTIEMIESWMIHGTDHWFIKPSIWYTLSENKRKVILNDILSIEKNIGVPYRHSIFDALRSELLNNISKENIDINEKEKIMLERNSRKLKRKRFPLKLYDHRNNAIMTMYKNKKRHLTASIR